MKKVIVCSLTLFLFSSCKKVYQCECVRIVNGEDWNPIVTNIPIEDQKQDAEVSCQSLGYTLGWQDYQSCKIKN